MVQMRRQSSHAENYAANYGGYDASARNKHQKSMSDRFFFGDDYGSDEHDSKGLLKSTRKLSRKELFIIVQYVVFIAVFYYAWSTNTQLKQTVTELTNMNQEYAYLEEALLETDEELKNAHDDFDKLQKKLTTINPLQEDDADMSDSKKRMEIADKLFGRHDAQAQRMVAMQERIQQIHKNYLELL